MHNYAYQFVTRAVQSHSPAWLHVLEIGSLDVNGSVRALFNGCASYTGIDRQPGRGVDEVAAAQDYDGKDFDVVVSTEAIEHDPQPERIIEAAWRLLKDGGLLIMTAAAPERAPHNCDGSPWGGVEPYQNIDPDQLVEWLAQGWEIITLEHNERAGDVYVVARKKAQPEEIQPRETKARKAKK